MHGPANYLYRFWASMPNIVEAFDDWWNARPENDVEAENEYVALASSNVQAALQPQPTAVAVALTHELSASAPASHAAHHSLINFAAGFGLLTGTLAGIVYFLTSFYSASEDFGTSSHIALISDCWLAGCAAIINAVLFYLTGRDTWNNWATLPPRERRNRLFLMVPGLLPATIFLALMLKTPIPRSAAWVLGLLMMALRDLLNGQALEQVVFLFQPHNRHRSRFLHIFIAILRDAQSRGMTSRRAMLTVLAWPIIMTGLAAVYTASAHSRVSEALTDIAPIFGIDYASFPIEIKRYFFEALACTFLASLNILWTLTTYLCTQSLPVLGRYIVSPELLRTTYNSLCATGDLFISFVLFLAHRNRSELYEAWQRDSRAFKNGLWLTLILSSGFSAIALVIMGSAPTVGSTAYSLESTMGFQVFSQGVSCCEGVQMNANSTWMFIYEREELNESLAYIVSELYRTGTMPTIDLNTMFERLESAREQARIVADNTLTMEPPQKIIERLVKAEADAIIAEIRSAAVPRSGVAVALELASPPPQAAPAPAPARPHTPPAQEATQPGVALVVLQLPEGSPPNAGSPGERESPVKGNQAAPNFAPAP